MENKFPDVEQEVKQKQEIIDGHANMGYLDDKDSALM